MDIGQSLFKILDWNAKLKPYFSRRLQIIGEIPISESDIDELAVLTKELIEFLGLSNGTDYLRKNTPLVFMTLLAHFAALNDETRYWGALIEKVGATQSLHAHGWHKIFVALAIEHNLKTFSKKDMDNFYVASIRYHGGIPRVSLFDFFERMVEPAVTREGLREIPTKDALKHLLANVRFVDKPVLDFLNNSGEMGEAWFDACCKLVRHARENQGEMLAVEEVPLLPRYIHTFFEGYNEGKQEKGFHWRKPYLQVAPYSEDTAVTLIMPAQIISIDLVSEQLSWQITWQGLESPIIIPCTIKRQRQDYIISEIYFAVPDTPANITVAITATTESLTEPAALRRWMLPLLPPQGQTPIVAFWDDQRQVTSTSTLPAGHLYLLMPYESSLTYEGQSYKVETCPALVGAWKDWKIEFWNLTEAISILLSQDGNPLGEVIPIERELAQPELVEGHLFAYQENPEQPLYTTGIPSIRIPFPKGATKTQALSGWKVRIQSLWETEPTIEKEILLQDFVRSIIFTDDRATFPLTTLLGEKPAGVFDIKVNGPRGLKSEHRIRLWPKLILDGYNSELPEPKNADQPFQFTIRLQEHALLAPQAGTSAIDIELKDSIYHVSAAPDVRRVELDLITKNKAGEDVRVPVSIPVVRLRWALAEEKAPGGLTFDRNMINISTSRFDQYQSSALHVEMHGLGEMLGSLRCQLIEMDSPEQVLQEAKFYRTDFTRDWLRVSLKQFGTTVQASNAQLEFDLVYQKDKDSAPIRYALLGLSPQLDIRNVRLNQESSLTWRLTWQEEHPLKHRWVMIKSTWKPWEPPVELEIPDKARGELLIKDMSLPPSQYEVYFYIRRSWEPALTIPPDEIIPHLVALCTAEERLIELEKPMEGHDKQFRASIEKACIYDSLGMIKERDISVTEGAKNLIHLQDVTTLVGSIKWIQSKNVEQSYKSFFLRYLFKKELTEAILAKYPPDDKNLQTYLHMITEVKTVYEDTAKYLLNHVNDSIVFQVCVIELLRRKSLDLAGIILKMLKEARLSKNDAVSILLSSPEKQFWVLERVCELPKSNYTEALITGLLSQMIDNIDDFSNECMLSAISRAILYEESSEKVCQYLAILIKANYQGAQKTLLLLKEEGILDDEQFEHLLEIDPEGSIAILRDKAKKYGAWITELEMKYPKAAGMIELGMELETPFGIAQVEKILRFDGSSVNKIHKSEPGLILEMVQGSGYGKVNAVVDFNRMTIRFKGYSETYRCGLCNIFVHPLRSMLDQHKRLAHPLESLSFKMEIDVVYFNIDEIKYPE